MPLHNLQTVRRKRDPLTEDQLKGIIAQNVTQAISFNDWLNEERTYNLQMYNADPDAGILAEREEGWSSLVSPDTRTVIESVMPSLMRIFASGDRVLTFAPSGEEDVEAAEQETEILSHVLMKQNDGFTNLYDWMHDALLNNNGVASIGWDESEWVEEEPHEDLDDNAYAVLVQQIEEDEDAEIIEHTLRKEETPVPPEALPIEVVQVAATGQIPPPTAEITFHDVQVRRTHTEGKPRWGVIAPEEFLITPRARTIRDSAFVGHRRRVPVSELIAEGFPRELIDGLPLAGEYDDTLKIERHNDNFLEHTETDESMREVWRTDCYIRLDGDGDGIAELRHIVVGGENEILSNEVVEYTPYYSITPLRQPHRWQGKSLAWLVNDIQLLRSFLLRGMSNNIALTNDPIMDVSAPGVGDDTITDILTRGPGRIVRTKMPGMMREIPTQGILPSVFQLMDQSLGDREDRTGVTRYSMGTDANTLNKTATGISLIQEAANHRIELIARVFAETGIKELFLGMHNLLRQHGTKPMTIRMRGEWVEVESSKWQRRMDMEIHVGIGMGGKDTQLAHINNLLQIQLQAIQLQDGVQGPLVKMDNVFNLLEAYVEASGRKDVERYFTRPNPQEMGQRQERPDPEVMKQQALMQMKQQESQQDMQITQAKAQADMQTAQAKAQAGALKAESEIQIARQKAAAEIQVENMKAQAEIDRKLQVAQADAQIRAQKATDDAALKAATVVEHTHRA
tara:strand:- start:4384 stop:6600 length:2217 start_codon:yes stop_codon:yes gene_type:complete